MRIRYLAFALAWIIANPAPSWAQSAPVSDTVLRAAYCVGVLSEAISVLSFKPGEITDSEAAKSLDRARKHNEQKRQRYSQYLAVQMLTSGELQGSILAIGEKGKADARRKTDQTEGPETTSIQRKRQTWCGDGAYADPSECTIQCIAKQDQVYANILKCLHQPDQLPF